MEFCTSSMNSVNMGEGKTILVDVFILIRSLDRPVKMGKETRGTWLPVS